MGVVVVFFPRGPNLVSAHTGGGVGLDFFFCKTTAAFRVALKATPRLCFLSQPRVVHAAFTFLFPPPSPFHVF